MTNKSWWPWSKRSRRPDRAETEPPSPRLQVGQVWRYRTRPGEESSRARVLVLEEHPAFGDVVHIRVDGVLIANHSDSERGPDAVLGHIPITRAAFCRSLIDVADIDPAGAEPADAELEGYRHWRDAEGGVFALPLAETIDAVQTNLTGQPYTAWIDDNVALALRALGPSVDFEMGIDRQSLVWLEGYLERGRNTRGFDAQGLVPVLGSFLGQCLVEHGRGTWLEDENGWLVRLPGVDARPFDKVDKQARLGQAGGESLVSFYDLVLERSAEHDIPD